jgi:hypothetical protein
MWGSVGWAGRSQLEGLVQCQHSAIPGYSGSVIPVTVVRDLSRPLPSLRLFDSCFAESAQNPRTFCCDDRHSRTPTQSRRFRFDFLFFPPLSLPA